MLKRQRFVFTAMMVKKSKSSALLLLNTFLYNKEVRALFKPTPQYYTILDILIHLGGINMDLEASFGPHMATHPKRRLDASR